MGETLLVRIFGVCVCGHQEVLHQRTPGVFDGPCHMQLPVKCECEAYLDRDVLPKALAVESD